MIYTLTLNPALDYVLKVDKLGFDDINRAYESRLFFGGKGINVSAVLTRLKTDNTALGFIGGFSGKKLEEMGAKNVLVSLAENGALLIDEAGKQHIIKNAPGTLVNSVGCGDSMVAGFLAGYINSGDYEEALRIGTACANATAYSEGLCTAEDIEKACSG